MAGQHTLDETERQVQARLGDLKIDFEAMAVTSNLFRAANAVRNYLERTVLAEHDLSWTAFVVLWVVWIWEPIETRQIADEGGFSKATLTGVLGTLEGRGLLKRNKSPEDGRLVIVRLTPTGRKMMDKLFPEFNREEKYVVETLSAKATGEVADHLREMTRHLES
jgi:DNA-binding MarR family transcriptional regulator